jgi:hypothetical protein
LNVRHGLPSLRTVKLVREWERSLAAACDCGRFRLVQYSLQNDHLHAIVEATSAHDLLAQLRRSRSAVGRVDPASSGRWFSGWNRRFQLASSLDPPSVASPRTWLLRVGWRRHGSIDPCEVPGAATTCGAR